MKVRTFENKKKRSQLRFILLLTEEEAGFIQTSLKNTLPFVRRQYNIERKEAEKANILWQAEKKHVKYPACKNRHILTCLNKHLQNCKILKNEIRIIEQILSRKTVKRG